MDLVEVRELAKGLRIAQGNDVDAMVHERRKRRDDRRLLAAAERGGRDEHGRELARERAGRPELAGRVPERLPLGGEVAVAGGDAEEEGVELGEVAGREDRVRGLGGRVQLGEDVLGERLGDPVLGGEGERVKGVRRRGGRTGRS